MRLHDILQIVQTQTDLYRQVRDLQLATAQPLGSMLAVTADVLFSFGIAMYFSWKLTLVIVSTLPVMLMLLAWLGTRMQSRLHKQHEIYTSATNIIINAINTIDLVKCSLAEIYEASRYISTVRLAASWYHKVVSINASQVAITQFVGSAMFVQGFYYGGVLVNSGQKSTADVVTTFLAAVGAFSTVTGIVTLLLPLEKGRSAAVALQELIDVCNVIGNEDTNGSTLNLSDHRVGTISFRDVEFSYPSRPTERALDGLTCKLQAGETTFIMGKSGSGKSTIGNLLLRLYEPQSGIIAMNGTNIQDFDLQWLRMQITIVDQSSSLFDMTIGDNIALGRVDFEQITEQEVTTAALFAQLDSIVLHSTDGIDKACGPHGEFLSGGQRQRVALARARLRDTPILILDEPTSAVDIDTRDKLIKEIRAWRRGKTTIIITHDPSLLLPTDTVYVIEDGKTIHPDRIHDLREPFEPMRVQPRLRHRRHVITPSARQVPTPDQRDLTSRLSRYSPDADENRRSYVVGGLFGTTNTVFRSSMLRSASPWSQVARSPSPVESELVRQTSYRRSAHMSMIMDKSPNRRSMAPLRAIFADDARTRPGERSHSIGKTVTFTSAVEDADQIELDVRNERTSVALATRTLPIRRVLWTIWPHLDRGKRWLFLVALLLCMAHAAVTPVFAFVLSRLIGTYGTGKTGEHDALIYAMSIIALSALDAVCVFCMHISLEQVGQAWIDDIRRVVSIRILHQAKDFYFHDGNSAQLLAQSLDRDADEMRNILGRFLSLAIVATTMIIASLTWALAVQWKLTLITLAAAPYVWLVSKLYGSVNARWEAKSAESYGQAARVMTEAVTSIKTVKAYNMQSFFQDQHRQSCAESLRIGWRRALFTGFFYGQSEAAGVLVQALVFAVGARLVRDGVSVSSVTQVFLLLILTTTNVSSMLGYIPQVNASRDAATRLLRLASLPERNHEDTGAKVVSSIKQIQFHGVRFGYPSSTEQVLRGLNMVIEAGSLTAIVGPSGCGKSTILALLLKLYMIPQHRPSTRNTETGRVSISGRDIDQLDTTFVRQRIAMVAQTPVVLSASIADNITYGLPVNSRHASVINIRNAAQQAGLDEFITSLPDGYATLLGEGGTALSGGQSQRLSIARALVRKPQVLLLDEATSALDGASASDIRIMLRELVDNMGMTIIAVTHSREMMETVDSVIVVDKGVVVQRGPFEELINFRDGPLHALVGGDGGSSHS